MYAALRLDWARGAHQLLQVGGIAAERSRARWGAGIAEQMVIIAAHAATTTTTAAAAKIGASPAGRTGPAGNPFAAGKLRQCRRQ